MSSTPRESNMLKREAALPSMEHFAREIMIEYDNMANLPMRATRNVSGAAVECNKRNQCPLSGVPHSHPFELLYGLSSSLLYWLSIPCSFRTHKNAYLLVREQIGLGIGWRVLDVDHSVYS